MPTHIKMVQPFTVLSTLENLVELASPRGFGETPAQVGRGQESSVCWSRAGSQVSPLQPEVVINCNHYVMKCNDKVIVMMGNVMENVQINP